MAERDTSGSQVTQDLTISTVSELDLIEDKYSGRKPLGLWADTWRRLKRNHLAVVGMCIIIVFLAVGMTEEIASFTPKGYLAPYNPIYVTLDYASQYVRATRTSRLTSSVFDSGSGRVTAFISGQTDLDTQLYVFNGADSGISNVVATVPMFSGSITSTVAAFPAMPVIIQPPAGQTNQAGATVVLSVEATGSAPLSYRWYRNVTNQLTAGTGLINSAGSNLTLVDVLGADRGGYTVVVSNGVGAVTSTPPAVLTVIDPVIKAQPVSQTNFAGSVAVFNVQADGTSLQYQWYKDGAPVTNSTQAALVLTGVTSSDAGEYSVVVSNAFGVISSIEADLSVDALFKIHSMVLGTDGVRISWVAVPGETYLLQSKDSLADTNWTSIPPPVTATSSVVFVTNALKNPQQFYRAIQLP